MHILCKCRSRNTVLVPPVRLHSTDLPASLPLPLFYLVGSSDPLSRRSDKCCPLCSAMVGITPLFMKYKRGYQRLEAFLPFMGKQPMGKQPKWRRSMLPQQHRCSLQPSLFSPPPIFFIYYIYIST